MKREEIERLAEKYQAKADKAYSNYQDTGITRYDREYRNNEDLAEALRLAAQNADREQERIALRISLSDLAYSAKRLMDAPGDQKAEKAFMERVVAEAEIRGLISRRC